MDEVALCVVRGRTDCASSETLRGSSVPAPAQNYSDHVAKTRSAHRHRTAASLRPCITPGPMDQSPRVIRLHLAREIPGWRSWEDLVSRATLFFTRVAPPRLRSVTPDSESTRWMKP